MWLLNTSTYLLEHFLGYGPKYAILSHTWSTDPNEELSFQDIFQRKAGIETKSGYKKMSECCRLARDQNLRYIWIDTCCIDKSSSAELSEAINSMFQWYKESSVCYVYLVDVPSHEDPSLKLSGFWEARWFTRGWVRLCFS